MEMNKEILKSNFSKSNLNQLFYLDNLTVDFGKIVALKSVHLVINPGDLLFITGASGSGKTTLLKTMAGQVNPTSGRIIYPQKNFFTSMVFQDLKLINNETCEQNLWQSYDPAIYKGRNEFYSELLEFCKLLGVKDFLDLPIEKANGGLKQKVAIIRSLLTRPDILLADEPTSALDRESSRRIFDLLNYYNVKKRLTIIWATHNKELVTSFSGKAAHLDGGRLIYTGHACFI